MNRGNLLWTGSRMMLSEHRQALNQRLRTLEETTSNDLELLIDEQQLEEWQHILEEVAIRNDSGILVIYGKDRKKVMGHLIAWDSSQQVIYIEEKEQRLKIDYTKIIHLEAVDYKDDK